MKKLILLSILIMFSFPAFAIDWCSTWHPKDMEARDLCYRDKALKKKEKEKTIVERENKLTRTDSSTQSSNSGTILNLGALTGKGDDIGPPRGNTELHRESRLNITLKIPAFSFNDQKYAEEYGFVSTPDCFEINYKFGEIMQIGGGYISANVPALDLDDIDYEFYETVHYYAYIGFRSLIKNDSQIEYNIGISDSNSLHGGEGDDTKYSLGIYADIKYVFYYGDFSFGPSLTILKAHSAEAQTTDQVEDAGFTKVGFFAQVPIPIIGYVSKN